MGIITYLFHRSNDLSEQIFKMFFLDMGENIHFHYRDLRIEFSVDEFKELVTLFDKYKEMVLKEIEAGYLDGVLPNTNDTKTLKTYLDKDKELIHPVKYNSNQISIEETKDGYHLHIRNYKILLHKESFIHFARAMAKVLPVLEDESSIVRDPYILLKQNDLNPQLLSRSASSDQEALTIGMADIYRRKASQVLRAIGYIIISSNKKEQVFKRNGSQVVVTTRIAEQSVRADNDSVRKEVMSLLPFMLQYGSGLSAEDLNSLKLKVLSLFKLAEQKVIAPFSVEDIYVNTKSNTPVVDLFAGKETLDPAKEYARLNNILSANKLFFVKPIKKLFNYSKQDQIQAAFMDFLQEKLIPNRCVSKLYLLGSTAALKSGRYQVPFVHFDWAKINSDFDIYIELDPEYEEEIPAEWTHQFTYNKNDCEYYHFGDVGNGMGSELCKLFPGVTFYEYLVEGYLYIPSKSDKKKKDAWLHSTKAACVFSRDSVAQWINEQYPITITKTERFAAASFNRVYHATSEENDYVLKIYDHRYLSKKKQDKVAYEVALLNALKESGLEISFPIKNQKGEYITVKEKDQAVLFTFVHGEYLTTPDREKIEKAGGLLARVHLETKKITLKNYRTFDNKSNLDYWLDAWNKYLQEGAVSTDHPIDIEYYRKVLKKLATFSTHCHGDLSPINYLFQDDQCWLIDFQSLGYGPGLIDLANGMVEFAQHGREFNHEDSNAFKIGYEKIRKLSRGEKSNLKDLLVIHILVRQARLLRLHYGGFGYGLKKDRLAGLRKGLDEICEKYYNL
jgi:Ser/Thr protein kinase RdoA (MazF antagonist)